MSDEAIILDELTASRISIVGKPVQDASSTNRFYVFVEATRNKFGFQQPSNYKLRRLSEKFSKRDLDVNFIILEGGQNDIQATVKATLSRSFPDMFRNAFVSFGHKSATVWVEPKKVLTKEEEELVICKTNELLAFLKIPLDAVKITSSENTPTRTACLNVIRRKAPLTQKELQTALISDGFHIPNEEWLSRMVDQQRKAGHLVRQKNGQIVLTLSGLNALGSSKNRRSPDIARALDIAKRGF